MWFLTWFPRWFLTWFLTVVVGNGAYR